MGPLDRFAKRPAMTAMRKNHGAGALVTLPLRREPRDKQARG